jgi:TrmH family RNA methyltransferase
MQESSAEDIELIELSLVNNDLVFLDGFHAVKHAMIFGAEMLLLLCANYAKLKELSGGLGADLTGRILSNTRSVRWRQIERIVPGRAHWTGLWGVATRPSYSEQDAVNSEGPIVLLENPENPGNTGACIRVAAAGNAGAVIVIGGQDLWSPSIVRAAAGLHFAIPVIKVEHVYDLGRPLVAIDPNATERDLGNIPDRAVLAFGNERTGISTAIDQLAIKKISFPMREGVSSLNLAVAVGIALYSLHNS